MGVAYTCVCGEGGGAGMQVQKRGGECKRAGDGGDDDDDDRTAPHQHRESVGEGLGPWREQVRL